jgi:hypothetical protein
MQIKTELTSVRIICKMCGIALVLRLIVIKSGCNRSDNNIQSSELEPIIIVTCIPYTAQYCLPRATGRSHVYEDYEKNIY